MRKVDRIFFSIGILWLASLSGCAQKPVLELQEVREAIAAARDFEADIYAPEVYQNALLNMEGGEFAIAEQDAAPPWSRNYETALDLLALAFDQAEEALAIAEADKQNVFLEAQNALPQAERMLQVAFEAVEGPRAVPSPDKTSRHSRTNWRAPSRR